MKKLYHIGCTEKNNVKNNITLVALKKLYHIDLDTIKIFKLKIYKFTFSKKSYKFATNSKLGNFKHNNCKGTGFNNASKFILYNLYNLIMLQTEYSSIR